MSTLNKPSPSRRSLQRLVSSRGWVRADAWWRRKTPEVLMWVHSETDGEWEASYYRRSTSEMVDLPGPFAAAEDAAAAVESAFETANEVAELRARQNTEPKGK